MAEQMARIYRLLCGDGHYYIGATIQSLSLRLNTHKHLSKTTLNKIYTHLNKVGWDQITIELVEECLSTEKKGRLQQHIDSHKDDPLCLNYLELNMYRRGKIYSMKSEDGHYYIGSTTQSLSACFQHHKEISKTHDARVYEYCKQVGWDHITMELLEEYPCDSKKELDERMNHHLLMHELDFLCLNHDLDMSAELEAMPNDHADPLEDPYDSDDSLENGDPEDRYQHGKIYRLVCEDSHFYIGSTITSLEKRLGCHLYAIKHRMYGGKYAHLYTIPINEIYIELIEHYPCDTQAQLRKRENDHISRHKDHPLCLNTYRAYREEDDKKRYDATYYRNNRESIKKAQQQYYEENREKIRAYHVRYSEENADRIADYQASYKASHRKELAEKQRAYAKEHKEELRIKQKEYRNSHKEEVKAYFKKYAEENKEAVAARKRAWAQRKKEETKDERAEQSRIKREAREQKTQQRITHENTIVTCECGGTYQNYRKKRHDSSALHQRFMETRLRLCVPIPLSHGDTSPTPVI